MEDKYRVTGKFRLLNGAGEIIKEEAFINKKTTAEGPRAAMKKVLAAMKKVFTEKYEEEITLEQISDVIIRRN